MAKPEETGKPEETPGLGKEDAPGQKKGQAETLPDDVPVPE